jgi:CDP-diacylglycerol--serine O-phosphatidyltransferase
LKIKETLPTTVTLGNMVCGFISILCILNNQFEIAAWLIIASMALDAFDGRLARMMKTTSKIGAQLDSMADLVTFGIAPAILMIKTCTNSPQGFLWIFGLFFMMCATFRLARFNVQKEDGLNIPRHFFTGLPTTLSGGTIAQLVILNRFLQTKFETDVIITLLPFICIMLGILMVSKIPFFNITGKISVNQGIITLMSEFSAAILFFAISPQLALSTTLSCYLLICSMYGIVKSRQIRKGYSTA